VPTPNVYPVSRRFIGIGKEAVAGTAVAPTFTFPMTTFTPSDKPTWLKDTAWRNAMAATYGIIQGPEQAELDLGGPFYGDAIGYLLQDMFGDYAVTGSTPLSATTISAQANAGASSITLTSPTGYTAGVNIQIGTGTTAEIRKQVGAPAGSVVTLDSPLYYTHTASTATTTVSAPFTHKFYLLNNGTGAGGSIAAQPPTYTMTDYTGLTATVEARSYSSMVLSELTFTGNAEDLLMWTGKASSWISAPAGTKPTAAVTSTATQASWRSVCGIGGPATGGTLINNVQEWSFSISRDIAVEFTNQNTQNPYSIVRGPMTVTGGLNFMPAIDESPLLAMLTNAQPQLQVVADNGLAGSNKNTITFDSQLGAYTQADLNAGNVPFGYDVQFESVSNTTNIGQSLGFAPLAVTLVNNVYNY
jgi:hypothetical protein